MPSWLRPLSSGLLFLLLYAAVAAATLGANPFKGQTVTPFDVLVSQRAWQFVDPGVEVRSYERSDILNALLPQWEVAKQQIREGQVPLWNDKVAGGGTFLSLNTNLFTPAFVIFTATPDPARGFYLATLFNLALAGLGMHLFLRRHVGWLAAIVAAVTFQFCGFNTAWLYWPHMFTLMWAPWVFWAIDRCAGRPGMRSSLLLAATSALVWLGGFPFLSVLVMEMAALYALLLLVSFWRRKESAPWPFAGWCLAGALVGLLLAALPLLGLVYWLQQFDLGYRQGRGSYLDLGHWKQLLPPWAYQVRRVEQSMYVGASMMAWAAVGVVAILARWRRLGALSVFAVLLVAITAALVFELWPMWLIGWLPGMAFNSWSRAIGLLDIGLIILGALGLDWLWRAARERHFIFHGALVLIGLVQMVEVSMYFRGLNGPVDSDYYFPQTATIDYVRDRTGPFDYVITDRSFLMSGTLGVYGQREWLAHYFRTPALQDALHRMAKRPFNSHRASASRFPASDIQYESLDMADYNVRYALIDSRHGPNSPVPIDTSYEGERRPLPAMPAHSYVQGFEMASATSLAGVSVRLATYRQAGLSGQVLLTLRDEQGSRLADARLPASLVVDNQYADFLFNSPVTLEPGDYAFVLAYSNGDNVGERLTAWAVADKQRRLAVDKTEHAGTIEYRVLASGTDDGAFQRVFTAEGTAVLENVNSPGGPYYISRIEDHPDRQSGQPIEILDYLPDDFTLRYNDDAQGYVIVPMSMSDDWHVSVDGKQVAPVLKDGVMPAVAVSSPATIRFEYRPALLRWLLPWLATVIAALVLMALVDTRSHKAGR
ncbi:hypothetical protein [Lysobacter sp. A03]|uniref:hypothetical protein n=1 Tax=Lysobacter sp. A03 TaxID=1199154 RepID=UPI0005B6D24D|nr:hypothetical protein [Lysobacter sp. A03]KIQ97627.1 putative membrane protein [Lysobacter sp. A03]